MIKGCIAAFFFILVVSCAGCGVNAMSGASGQQHTVSEGVAELQEMESRDIAYAQDAISDKQDQSVNEDKDASSQSKNLSDDEISSLNFRDIFSDSVIMGDSIADSITEYDLLNSSQVIAEIGANISSADDQIRQASALNPKNVFLTYGLNDMINYQENYDDFRDSYDDFLTNVEEAMPDARVYVNLTFPVTEYAVSKEPRLGYANEYKAIEREVCDEHGIPCFDNSDLAKEEYYEPDGIHFKSTFYPFWLYRLAQKSGLL